MNKQSATTITLACKVLAKISCNLKTSMSIIRTVLSVQVTRFTYRFTYWTSLLSIDKKSVNIVYPATCASIQQLYHLQLTLKQQKFFPLKISAFITNTAGRLRQPRCFEARSIELTYFIHAVRGLQASKQENRVSMQLTAFRLTISLYRPKWISNYCFCWQLKSFCN